MDTQAEKRQFLRLNLSADITYAKIANLSDKEFSVTRNISQGGICFIAYEKLDAGDILKLSIALADKKELISAQAKVSWVKEFIMGEATKGMRYDIGAEFIEIDEKDREGINKYIFSHL